MANLVQDLVALAGVPKSPVALVSLLVVGAVCSYLGVRFIAALATFFRLQAGLAAIPMAPGGNFLLGHVVPLLTCVRRNKGAWDVMEEWLDSVGPIVKYRILNTWGVIVRDPPATKRIFQNAFKIYEKDLELSYRPFLPILGTGLVTADGQLWQDQRKLMGPALRVEVLDDVIAITHRAVDRLSAKLAQHAGSGKPVDIEDEFRLLTLQIIGEAVLSAWGAGGRRATWLGMAGSSWGKAGWQSCWDAWAAGWDERDTSLRKRRGGGGADARGCGPASVSVRGWRGSRSARCRHLPCMRRLCP